MRANIAEYLRPFSVGWTAVVSAGGYRLQARVSVVTGVEASRGRHAGTWIRVGSRPGVLRGV